MPHDRSDATRYAEADDPDLDDGQRQPGWGEHEQQEKHLEQVQPGPSETPQQPQCESNTARADREHRNPDHGDREDEVRNGDEEELHETREQELHDQRGTEQTADDDEQHCQGSWSHHSRIPMPLRGHPGGLPSGWMSRGTLLKHEAHLAEQATGKSPRPQAQSPGERASGKNKTPRTKETNPQLRSLSTRNGWA